MYVQVEGIYAKSGSASSHHLSCARLDLLLSLAREGTSPFFTELSMYIHTLHFKTRQPHSSLCYFISICGFFGVPRLFRLDLSSPRAAPSADAGTSSSSSSLRLMLLLLLSEAFVAETPALLLAPSMEDEDAAVVVITDGGSIFDDDGSAC